MGALRVHRAKLHLMNLGPHRVDIDAIFNDNDRFWRILGLECLSEFMGYGDYCSLKMPAAKSIKLNDGALVELVYAAGEMLSCTVDRAQ